MSAYSDLILAHGADLWGYWRLGEPSGTNANDETANNRDGTYGAAVVLGQPGAIAGDPDTAASFVSGAGSYVKGSVIGPANDLFSLEIWAKRAAIGAGAEHTIFVNGDGGGGGWRLLYFTDNLLYFQKHAVANIVISTVAVANTNWHHLVVTRDTAASPTTKLYIDGKDRSGSVSAQTLVGQSPWVIGSRSAAGSSLGFNGLLAKAAIYTVALTPLQVAQHYYQGLQSGMSIPLLESRDHLLLESGDEVLLEELGGPTVNAAAATSGAGAIAGTGTRKTFAVGSLAGVGSVNATGTRVALAVGAISGTGGWNALGGVTRFGTATLTGTGSIQAGGYRLSIGTADLTGAGSVTATATRSAIVDGAVTGTGVLGATALVTRGPRIWTYDGTATVSYGATPVHSYDHEQDWTYEPVN